MPLEVGFLDTVGRNNAQSMWMKGHYVNTLAAMPSMHFAYAFCIGVTLLHHSAFCEKLSNQARDGNRNFQRYFMFYLLLRTRVSFF